MDVNTALKSVVKNQLWINELTDLKNQQKEIKSRISILEKKVDDDKTEFNNSKSFLKQREKYINNLENRHPEVEYISGYKMRKDTENNNFKVLLRDRNTGIRFYASASNVRKPNWKPNIATKNKSFIFKDDLEKWYPIAGRNNKGIKIKIRPIIFTQCKNCGRTFESKWGAIFCSDKCKRRFNNLRSQRQKDRRTKRAKKNGKYDSSITLEKVYKKYHGFCYICGKHMILDRKNYNHPDSPTIEHVVPICRGGTHTWDNVRLACRECNNHKSKKTYQEYLSSEAS